MRKRTDDVLKPELRDSGEYRGERLEEERQRLERRLTWALRRGDARVIERLTQRLDALEEAIAADLSPGRPPSKFDRSRRW